MSTTKKHLLKKVALVALTVTSVAATSGVVDAGSSTAPKPTTTVSTSPYDGVDDAPAFRSGIRW